LVSVRSGTQVILDTQTELRLQNGAIFAVPIPQEYEAKGEMIQQFVNQAVAESESNGMSKRGKEVTPWLLARVVELTKGESMESNMALLRNTARVGKTGSSALIHDHHLMNKLNRWSDC
jgi:pseudouridine-5'-phosphate glycosidase/pseudouridine kinase